VPFPNEQTHEKISQLFNSPAAWNLGKGKRQRLLFVTAAAVQLLFVTC